MNMRLARTAFALEEVSGHVAASGNNPLISSYLVQYLLILFYSELEEHVKNIIFERISKIDDHKVSSFITKTNEQMIKRVKKSEINDVLKLFNCGDGDIIKSLIPETNLQPYFDAINNRHLVSHSGGSSMTLMEFSTVLPCAEAILNAVKMALEGA